MKELKTVSLISSNVVRTLPNILLDTEEATKGVLWKKVFLKFFQISQENTCVGVSLIKVQTLRRDFNTGAFLWNLQNF